MTTYANLEIGLHRRDADRYRLELRFGHPESDAEVRMTRDDASPIRFDLARLRELLVDPAAYGGELGRCLLSDDAVQTAFAQAYSVAQSLDVPLRLRLFIGPSAPELHSLRWETLRHPTEDRDLLTGEQIVFSRYLSSVDWRPVGPRSQTDLRALVVIANPAGLNDRQPGQHER